jgi:hypothetical protein
LQEVFEKIGNPEFKDNLKFNFGINRDIIKTINGNFNKAVQETKKIAPYFKGKTPDQTCLNVWNFLKQKIKYVKDPDGYQFIKTPKRFLNEKTGDCKSYSLFAGGILKNLYPDAEVFLRYAGYSSINIPSHVYTIVKLNNKTYICDGVYKKPLEEKTYKHKEDYKMKIYTLSGTDENQNVEGWFSDAVKSVTKAVKKTTSSVVQAVKDPAKAFKDAKKSITDVAKSVVKSVSSGAKKVALAPVRGAFLGLLALNVKNLAKKVKLAIDTDPNKMKNFWENWGGDFNQLVETSRFGSTKKMIGYISQDEYYKSPQHNIGEPITLTAVAVKVATAGPIIVAILKNIKEIIGTKKEEELGKSDDIIADAMKNTSSTNPDEITTQIAPQTTTTATASGMNKNTMLLIGAGAVAVYLLTKKK